MEIILNIYTPNKFLAKEVDSSFISPAARRAIALTLFSPSNLYTFTFVFSACYFLT